MPSRRILRRAIHSVLVVTSLTSVLSPGAAEAELDWEHISEEEQRIWREDDGDFDLSEEESEEDANPQETFQTHLTSEVVIYKVNNKANYGKKQIENKKQTLTSF